MAIQRVAKVSGYSSGCCVSKVGMLSGMPVLTREKLGATGFESVARGVSKLVWALLQV